MLRQAVQVTPGETLASLFGISEALEILHRAELGEATADELAEADWTLEAQFSAALARVGLDGGPDTPLASLSGGQQTRARLAALIFAEPDFLLLDEPTNNLDRSGRLAVLDLLAGWRKGAIIVSHDRDLLETVDAIVELSSLGAARYGGNWSHYRTRKSQELAAAQQQLASAERQASAVARTAQLVAERKARKDSAGSRKAARGDMPKILAGARKDRSEGTGGASARLAEGARTEAEDMVAAARARVEILQPVSVALAATGLPSGRTVLRTRTGRRPRAGSTDHRRWSLTVTGPERVAITGPERLGKIDLSVIVDREICRRCSGTVANHPPDMRFSTRA